MKTTPPFSGAAAEPSSGCGAEGTPSLQGLKISNLFASDVMFLCCRLIEGIDARCLSGVILQMKEIYQAERQAQDNTDVKLISTFDSVLTAIVERSENGCPSLVRQWLTNTLRLLSLGSLRTLLERNWFRIPAPQARMPCKLPKHMWLEILSYLPAHEVFKHIRILCRSLFVVTLSQSYWRSMQTFTMNSFWFRQRCNWGPLLHRLEHIVALKIENLQSEDPTPSSPPGRVEESVAGVREGRDSDTRSGRGIAELLCYISQHKTNMQLLNLELPNCVQLSCSLVETISSKFPSLQRFSITNASDLCDSVLRKILHSLNLKYLSIPGAYQISDSSFFGIGAKTGKSLLSLNLQRSFITNRGMVIVLS